MPLLHELGVKLLNQWKDGVHVLDSLVEGKERLPVLDVFVLWALWVALLGLHVLDEGHELSDIDLVPECGLPGLELEINEGDEIPQLLEVAEVVSAVLQELVRGFLHIEKSLEVVELGGAALEGSSLRVVITDLGIGLLNGLWGGFLDVIWHGSLESLSVLSDGDLELSKSVLDVTGLLVL